MKHETTFCGKPISFEINDLAQRADRSVVVRYGDTTVLAVVVVDEKRREGVDFVPLMIEYEERYYAAGKIFGSRFMRREGRPSFYAVLNGRLIDRTVRPLFPKHFTNPVQINTMVLSFDPASDPDVASLLGASLALSLSPADWRGPVGCARFVKRDGVVSANPSIGDREGEEINAIFAGPKGRINMIEAGASEVSEKDVMDLANRAMPEIDKIIDFQNEIVKKLAPEKKFFGAELSPELKEITRKIFSEKFSSDKIYSREEDPAQKWIGEFQAAVGAAIAEKDASLVSLAGPLVEDFLDDYFNKSVLERKERPDGRKFSEIRPISIALDILPKVHGSATFYRGLTHTLSAVTLSSPADELMVKDIEFEGTKRFLHHYNFPNFSVHELGPSRSPGRREIGHGALAEKAVDRVIPSKEEFPYTIRAVSEVLSSNGSTSMASTCSTTLALMVAGVPIKRPVGGISIGLAYETDERYELLTDIQGPEDHYGEMDFKVAGTSEGITAIQMDTKISGITLPMLEAAFTRAREARTAVLKKMTEAIAKPRATLKDNVPRIRTFKIDPTKIGMVIGSGGKTINEIIQKSGAQIDIQDDNVFIVAEKEEALALAEEMIKRIVKDVEVGDIVTGKIFRIREFGALVDLGKGQTALIHINEFPDRRIPHDLPIGRPVALVVKSIDHESGKISVSFPQE